MSGQDGGGVDTNAVAETASRKRPPSLYGACGFLLVWAALAVVRSVELFQQGEEKAPFMAIQIPAAALLVIFLLRGGTRARAITIGFGFFFGVLMALQLNVGGALFALAPALLLRRPSSKTFFGIQDPKQDG